MSRPAVAVIPAHDEEDRIAGTIRALKTLPHLERLIVVDDGSHDRTADEASAAGAEVIPVSSSGRPVGKGLALLRGLKQARSHDPAAILFADADLGPSAARLGRLLDLLDKDHPAIFATFPPSKNAGFGLVKGYARREIARRTGYAPTEPLSGQRALLAPALDSLPGLAPGFGVEVGMTLDLLGVGIQPLEIPLHLEHRPTGRSISGFAHRARQGLDIFRAIHGARLSW